MLGLATLSIAMTATADAGARSNRAPATWTVVSENDSPWSLMWNNSYRDEYYTNGIRMSRSQWVAGHTDRGLGKVAQAAADVLHIGNADVVRFGLAQTMYTPIEIWEQAAIPDEHPYAGHLHFTGGMGAERDGLRTSIELLGGWTGPAALGEPAQKKVHEIFDGYEPMGWDHQVQFEPTFGVAAGLSVTELGSVVSGPVELRVVPTALAVAATTDVAAEVGGIIGFGTTGDVPTIRPEEARFGHSAVQSRTRGATPVGFAVYAFADIRATAHDMFIQGGTFSEVPAPELEHRVSEAGAGFTVRVFGTHITMVNNYQTRLYVGQPHDHVYGTISVAQSFGGPPSSSPTVQASVNTRHGAETAAQRARRAEPPRGERRSRGAGKLQHNDIGFGGLTGFPAASGCSTGSERSEEAPGTPSNRRG
jgi:lipid A 3-O-deacylase